MKPFFMKSSQVKEVSALETAALLQKDDLEYINGISDYIEELKSMPIEKARKLAQTALYESGVTERNGQPKKQIVTWE